VKVELASAELAQLQRRSKSYSCVEAFYIPGSNKQLPEGDITYVVDLSRPMEPHLVTLYPKACAALEITTGTAAAKYVHNEIKKYLR
jgi:hypothetical protein